MIKQDIQSRQDIETLIETFYRSVRQHADIGPFFNKMITDWAEHITRLCDFWETNLFFVKAYKGNPLKAHMMVDKNFEQGLEKGHFTRWLELWFCTIDNLFVGKNADLAKERARSMANIMFIRIVEARKKEDLYE